MKPTTASATTPTTATATAMVHTKLDDTPEQVESDVHVELSWSTPSTMGDPPSARGGHSAVLVADSQLLVFGGHYFGGHGRFVYLNDLHRLDLTTSTWHEITFPSHGAVVPRARYSHSAVLLPATKPLSSSLTAPRMFIFGGRGEDGVVFRDMFFLDLQAVAWFQVQWTTDCPSARFGHGCCVVDALESEEAMPSRSCDLLIFGGWDGKKSMGDLWRFATHTFTWTQPKCSGKPPLARQDHAMVSLAGDLVMVYGGYSVTPESLPVYHKDVYLLDAVSHTWSRPRLTGEYPVPTFGHSLVLPHEYALVVGGWSGTERTPLYMGDRKVKELVQTLAREERLASGHQPRETRTHHTQRLKQVSSYLRVLDVTRMQWFRVTSHGVAVANRYGHSATLVGNALFLFGGWDGNRALNQLVVGHITSE